MKQLKKIPPFESENRWRVLVKYYTHPDRHCETEWTVICPILGCSADGQNIVEALRNLAAEIEFREKAYETISKEVISEDGIH